MKSNQIEVPLTFLQKAYELADKMEKDAMGEELFAPLRNHPVF